MAYSRGATRSDSFCCAPVQAGTNAAGFAKGLVVPVSKGTLLWVVGRRAVLLDEPLNVDTDDWAWRRNYRYDTTTCDLERWRIVALLPDRKSAAKGKS